MLCLGKTSRKIWHLDQSEVNRILHHRNECFARYWQRKESKTRAVEIGKYFYEFLNFEPIHNEAICFIIFPQKISLKTNNNIQKLTKYSNIITEFLQKPRGHIPTLKEWKIVTDLLTKIQYIRV